MSDPRQKRFDPESAGKLADKLGRTQQRYRDVTWPGGALRVRLYAPTIEDQQLAYAAALERLRGAGVPVNAVTHAELTAENNLQVLALCIQDPLRPLPGFPGVQGRCEALATAEELRGVLDGFEREALVEELNELIESVAPDLAELVEEDRAIVEAALKKKDLTALRRCGSRTLSAFMLSMVGPQ